MNEAESSKLPGPDEARELLSRAAAVGAAATAGAGWPAIASLLTLGAATSIGTLALAFTTGAAYVASLVVMLAWVVVGIGFFSVFARSSKVGFQRRWGWYIAAWAVAYGIAIAVAVTSARAASATGADPNVVGACLGSALILLVTGGCAWREARS